VKVVGSDSTPRARAKREQIRSGATRVFIERGFSGASTDAIAAEAGVSKQTLYAYYSSKEVLLSDVLRRMVEEGSHGRLAEAIEGVSPRERDELRGVLTSVAAGLISSLMDAKYVALVRIVISETPRLPHLGHLFRSAVPEKILGGVGALLERAHDGGAIGEVAPDLASRAFVGPLLTYVLMDALFVGDGPPRAPGTEVLDDAVDLFMRVLPPGEPILGEGHQVIPGKKLGLEARRDLR
jgi:TetR/AcrR family transcriptional repressor of mexJK operon